MKILSTMTSHLRDQSHMTIYAVPGSISPCSTVHIITDLIIVLWSKQRPEQVKFRVPLLTQC